MHLRSTFLFFTTLLVIVGCDPFGVLDKSDDASPSDFSGEYIETTQNTYQWTGDTLTIRYEYKNPFDQTVYMGGCTDGKGPAHLFEKRIDGEWKRVYGRWCLLVGGVVPTSIKAMETYKASFELNEATLSNWPDSVPGTYRVREPIFWTWDEEKHEEGTLDSASWASNTFEIH